MTALPAGARWVLAVTAVLAFALAFQGSRPLWEPDEGRYAAVALEMIQLDDYLVPRLHHQYPHFTKPPLTYWLIAASLRTFGASEWAVRLPNVFAFAATVLLVYAIGRRLCPNDAALAAVVYASFLVSTVAANIANTDTLLTAFETLAVWGFTSWWWSPDRAHRGWLIVMWLGFGLAFLTKGPPGLLPLLGIGALVAASNGVRGLAALFPVAGIALFVVVGFSWYVAVVVRRPELVGYFLGEEFVGRIFTDQHGRNAEWYGAAAVYLPTFLLGALPWTAVLAARLRHADRVFRPSWWRDSKDWASTQNTARTWPKAISPELSAMKRALALIAVIVVVIGCFWFAWLRPSEPQRNALHTREIATRGLAEHLARVFPGRRRW